MRETAEFRIPERIARDYFGANEGVCLGGSVRKIEISVDAPGFARIGKLEQEFQANGRSFFLGWNLRRKYGTQELASAKAFNVLIKHLIEPTGEECGTVYDESMACEYCGVGGKQASDLILEASRLPNRGNIAIAKTIGGEIIASASFLEVFRGSHLVSAEFRLIKQRTRPLHPVPGWYQLIVTAPRLRIVPPTRAGIDPFDDGTRAKGKDFERIFDDLQVKGSWCDRHGNYRCPRGHTIGLNLISELSVQRSDFESSDIAFTDQCVGVRRGLLRPEPLLVISPKLWQLVRDRGLKGIDVEVAHLR